MRIKSGKGWQCKTLKIVSITFSACSTSFIISTTLAVSSATFSVITCWFIFDTIWTSKTSNHRRCLLHSISFSVSSTESFQDDSQTTDYIASRPNYFARHFVDDGGMLAGLSWFCQPHQWAGEEPIRVLAADYVSVTLSDNSNYVSNLQYSPSSGTVIHVVIFILCIQTITIMMQLFQINQPWINDPMQITGTQQSVIPMIIPLPGLGWKSTDWSTSTGEVEKV